MTYCIDFFRKFKKEGNFCDLDPGQVSRMNAYLEIVELLIKQKIPEKQVYENFTLGAATPLIAAKGEAHTEGLNFVTSRLKAGKKVQVKDVQSTLKSCKFTTSPTEEKSKVVKVEPIKPPVAPVVLHPEIKPTSPYQPTPGSIEVTDAQPQPSLAEQMKPERGIIPAPKPAPCKDHHPREDFKISDQVLFKCPDGKAHFTVEKVRGRVCDVIHIPIIQLPGNECPLERNARLFSQAATKPGILEQGNTAFSRAGELPKTETRWGMGKILTREEKMHVLCTQILIPKQVLVLRMLVKAGEADDELMAIDVIIDEAQARMEVA